MTERNNNKMFQGPSQAAVPEVSIQDELASMLGETANNLHDLEVPLPSKGIPYPVGHPMHGRTSVLIRSMRSGDEDILYNQALHRSGKIFSQLIKSCLIEPKCDPADLLQGDRNAILTAIRISGYGSEAKSEIKCPSCDKKSKTSFICSEFPVKYLEIDSVGSEEDRNRFVTTLPRAKVDVEFRFTTGHDEEEIWKALATGGRGSEKVTDHLRRIIHSINGETDRMKISLAVEMLSPADTDHLKKFAREKEPGLHMKQDWLCPNCGHESEVSISPAELFFRTQD